MNGKAVFFMASALICIACGSSQPVDRQICCQEEPVSVSNNGYIIIPKEKKNDGIHIHSESSKYRELEKLIDDMIPLTEGQKN